MRLIDADALDEVVIDLNLNRDFGITRGEYKLIDSVLFEFPTIEERKKGEWEFPHTDKRYKKCSVCGREFYSIPHTAHFCPNCGADMRGGKGEPNEN